MSVASWSIWDEPEITPVPPNNTSSVILPPNDTEVPLIVKDLLVIAVPSTWDEPLITPLASILVSTLLSKFVTESAFTWDEPDITPSASNFNFTFAFENWFMLP